MNEPRLTRLLRQAREQNFDALALVPGSNLFYISGHVFMLSERPIVGLFPVDASPMIVLPLLEADKVHEEAVTIFAYNDEDGFAGAFQEACASLSGATIGVEVGRMRLLEAHLLEQYAAGAILRPADSLLAELRRKKTPAEVDAMRRAIHVAEQAFRAWLPQLRLRMSEREAAGRLIAEILTRGADGLSFNPIVCGGPNGALPHAVPGERTFCPGDWIVVDWGAVVDGYASDITRMVVLGQPEGTLQEIHSVVLRANKVGRESVRPGLLAQEVDAAVRRVIDAAGYGERFIHRTGHGLGLECHEPPSIMAGETMRLEPGMTFTVEPGIYLPGMGGVRIEDDILVTKRGCETLTTLPRAPFTIPQ